MFAVEERMPTNGSGVNTSRFQGIGVNMSAVSHDTSGTGMRIGNTTHFTQATNPFQQSNRVPDQSYNYNAQPVHPQGKYQTFQRSDEESSDLSDEDDEFMDEEFESEFDEDEEDESSLSDYQPSEKVKNMFNPAQQQQQYYMQPPPPQYTYAAPPAY